ncbi:MAG: aminotransferase class IV [Anaerolineales bacterium]|nr:aminotransferase class IV [Anaerolineales bacterium]
MSTTIAIYTPEGLIPVDYSAKTLDEAVKYEPAGVYDVTRIFPKCEALLLDDHFDRLERSAALENFSLKIDRRRIRSAIRSLWVKSGYQEARLRFAIGKDSPDRIILTLEPYTIWAETLPLLKKNGVAVKTHEIFRENPQAKTNAWVKERLEAKKNIQGEYYEAIIIDDDGDLLEGFSTNFYAFIDGDLFTEGENILPGITRKGVLSVAETMFSIHFQAVNRSQIPDLQEAFITSSSRGIIPVVRIDQTVLGNGKPGERTIRLMKAFEKWVNDQLAPV